MSLARSCRSFGRSCLLQSNLTNLGENAARFCAGMAWRLLNPAEAIREWRPRIYRRSLLKWASMGFGCREG